MDAGLRRRAHARAAKLGISFAEYVRRVVVRDLGEPVARSPVSELFDLVADGPETDIARDKDRLIADAAWREHAGKLAKSRPSAGRARRAR